MIIHTLLNKCNTIIENSNINTGLNPVAELNAGNFLSRILVHFNIEKLKESAFNGEFNSLNLTHKIKMTNCGSINLPIFNEKIISGCSDKKRAASFNIIAFKIPYAWDEGRGFDYNGDYVKESHKIISKDPSNWFIARNGMEWDEHGVFFNRTLLKEYNEKFKNNQESIIIGEQHFDNGTENLEIDITDYINKVLFENEEFNGIGLAFSPSYENEMEENRFISFFTNHTNSFFHPYLETCNHDTVLDNRANFYLGCKNRLYFFVSDNGNYVNLDSTPTCTINGNEYEVKQSGKGSYYIELKFKKGEVEPNTIMYDIWSNIVLDGEELDDVEMEFVVLPFEGKVSLGNINNNEIKYQPQIYGINECESVKKGDIIELNVDFIEEYSYGKKIIPNESEYKIYVKENDREITIYPYQKIERRYDKHTFVIDTNELIPNNYYIDIKTKEGRNIKHYNEVLKFTIINNVTNYYK